MEGYASLTGLAQKNVKVTVDGGHDLVLSLGLDDGDAHTRGLERSCHKKDKKINNKNNKNNSRVVQNDCHLD